MGTIANQKGGSNVQIEMQGIGSSQASIMLQQPLLGESSESYTVEVTNFQMSLGEERATSKSTGPMMLIVNYSADGYDFQADDGFNTTDWDVYKNAMDSGANILDAWYAATRDIAQSPNEGVVAIEGVRSYSATDWVLQVSQKVSLATNGQLQFGVTPSGQFHLYSQIVEDADPNIPTFAFWEDHYVILDRSFQGLTGWKDIMYGYQHGVVTKPLDSSIDSDHLFDQYAFLVGQPAESVLSNQDDLAWETLDRRKRIRIDLTLPVGLTMGWKTSQQEKTYLLQEFDIPRGIPTCSFSSSRSMHTAGSTSIREKQLVSTTSFVDGGGKLAIQKLFPGPVQALRLNLILVYDEFDTKKQVWVEKAKPVEMGNGDFFYLKILFSKEST